MLIYHPAQDVSHCIYRLLLICEKSVHEEFDIGLLRILDFYTLFPHLLKTIKPLPAELAVFKKAIKSIHEPYETVRNSKRIMFELESLQTIAIQHLIAKNLLDLAAFNTNIIKRTKEPLPLALEKALLNEDVVNEEWFRLIVNELPQITFKGRKGFKSRSGLMEFRYDMEQK